MSIKISIKKFQTQFTFWNSSTCLIIFIHLCNYFKQFKLKYYPIILIRNCSIQTRWTILTSTNSLTFIRCSSLPDWWLKQYIFLQFQNILGNIIKSSTKLGNKKMMLTVQFYCRRFFKKKYCKIQQWCQLVSAIQYHSRMARMRSWHKAVNWMS